MANFKPEQNTYENLTPFKEWLKYQINTWGVTNFPFLENDFDQLTNYGMMMKLMKAVETVISNENLVENDMSKLYQAFTELQTYVNNTYEHIDEKVIEEVDNKLDEMVTDGTLLNLINNSINNNLEFNFLSSFNNYTDESNRFLSNCMVFKNDEKVGIIDLGLEPTCYYLIQFLEQNQITKIDYIIISHYHGDHIGGQNATGLEDLLDTDIDFSDCVAYLPHKNIDYTLFNGTEKTQIQANETQVKSLLTNKGISYIEPSNLDVLSINQNTSLQFLNIGDAFYQQYYNVTRQWTLNETSNTNYNNFSMVVILKHFNNKFLITGDIEEKAESLLYEYFKGIDVLQVEHHSLNRDSNRNYLSQLNPQISVICDIDPLEPHLLINNTTYNSYTKGSKIFHTRYENIKVISSYTKIYSENNQMKVFNVNDNIFGGLPIFDDTDLNNIVVEGSYFTLTGFVSQTLLNCPYVQTGFKMLVEKLTGANATIKQTIIPANNPAQIIYTRSYVNGSWINWEACYFGLMGKVTNDKFTIPDGVDLTIPNLNTSVTFINGLIIGNLEFTVNEEITGGSDILIIPSNFKMGNVNCPQTYRAETTNFSMVDSNGNDYSGYVGRVATDMTLHIRARKTIPANTIIHAQFIKTPDLRELSLYTTE